MPWLNDNIAALALIHDYYNGLIYEYMKEDIRYLNFFLCIFFSAYVYTR